MLRAPEAATLMPKMTNERLEALLAPIETAVKTAAERGLDSLKYEFPYAGFSQRDFIVVRDTLDKLGYGITESLYTREDRSSMVISW